MNASIACCEEFEKLTGVPVLLNTSFNIRGEPIVETPADAMKCFLSTGIDYLAMHDHPDRQEPLSPPVLSDHEMGV